VCNRQTGSGFEKSNAFALEANEDIFSYIEADLGRAGYLLKSYD